MENIDFFTLFQGFGTMAAGGWILAAENLFASYSSNHPYPKASDQETNYPKLRQA